MTTQHRQSSRKLKPRWRIRRLGLSIVLSCLVTSALLWASLLIPRTFIATAQWVANSDSLLDQIDSPPLHQLTADILKLSDTDHQSDLQFTRRSDPDPTLLITARTPSADQAISRVNQWITQRVTRLTEQLQSQLEILKTQHQSRIDQDQIQIQTLKQQLDAAQAQIVKTALPAHQVLSEKISVTQKQLEKLTRQQAVYRGANRTLKELFARRKLLEQDLVNHQKKYGRNDQDPAVILVKDQLKKINLRIDIIAKASKLGEQADAKLAAVAQQIDQTQQAITRYQKQQKQRVQQVQAQTLIKQLGPQYQGLVNQLAYHQKQMDLIDQALAGQLAWGTIQQASPARTSVIRPTRRSILWLAGLGGLCAGLFIQWFCYMTDKTLDQKMPLADMLEFPVLGHITLHRRRSLYRLAVYPLVSVAVALILIASLTAPGSFPLFHGPKPNAEALRSMGSPPPEAPEVPPYSKYLLGTKPNAEPLPVVIRIPQPVAQQLANKAP